MGTLRAGGVAGLVTNSATGEQMAAMIADTGARHLFLDHAAKTSLEGQVITASDLIAMDGSDAGTPLDAWVALAGAKSTPVDILPEDGFNIIYSSGTTGTPKGIVHSHAMRWQHIQRGAPAYGRHAVTILSTPLYSNTTMASFMPTVGSGGQVVLMKKFDARGFLELAERERATNDAGPGAISPDHGTRRFRPFRSFQFRDEMRTSAPFPATQTDVLARWSGGLVGNYRMTEGGAAFILEASIPRQATRRQTRAGAYREGDRRDGDELPQGSVGEVVGRSPQ